MSKPTLEKDGYVTELNSNDVLFGRGSGPNDHEGNIRFRALVSERKTEYMATSHRQTKAKIAREIVNQVIEKGGRFLKKVEPTEAKRMGVSKGVDAWCTVDDDTIMEKAKQALRQQRDKAKPASVVSGVPRRTGLSPPRSPKRVGSSSSKNYSPMRIRSYSPTPPMETIPANQTYIQPLKTTDGPSMDYSQGQNPFDPVPIGPSASGNSGGGRERLSPTPPVSGEVQGEKEIRSNRRESYSVQELISNNGRGNAQVQGLMDSFTKMNTKEYDEDDPRSHYESSDTLGGYSMMNQSTDTMGTIEISKDFGVPPGTVSLRSSFSRSSLRDGSRRESINIDDKDFFAPRRSSTRSSMSMSMSLSRVWDGEQLGVVGEEDEDSKSKSSAKAGGVATAGANPRNPNQTEENPENMSAMSIMNFGDSSVFNESVFSDIGE
mmetsp:Transcript_4118/g.6061  ORF Transcript_4118/g.6061 Transcript_4118/m.6061 type:complete len:434 (+) Transcript_4118:234-1535(+)